MLLRDNVYENLRSDILTCHFAPGHDMREQDLAERYAVSRQPVCEALLRLEREHLVTIQPRQGYRVNPISLADARDILRFRQALEPAGTFLGHHGGEFRAGLRPDDLRQVVRLELLAGAEGRLVPDASSAALSRRSQMTRRASAWQCSTIFCAVSSACGACSGCSVIRHRVACNCQETPERPPSNVSCHSRAMRLRSAMMEA